MSLQGHCRAAIAQAPKGTFYGEDAVDDDGLTDEPLVARSANAGMTVIRAQDDASDEEERPEQPEPTGQQAEHP